MISDGAYLDMVRTILAEREAMLFDTPEQRLKDFQAAFGEDLQRLDAAFVKYMLKVK